MSVSHMENSGRGPLRVPGFGDIPLRNQLDISQRFTHGIDEWKQVPAITMREFAMVDAMNRLTDKPDWHIDVFDPDVVEHWHEEISTLMPLMKSEKAWAWCVAELQDKASQLKGENDHIRVLDTGSCVCKLDVSRELCADFQSSLEPVLAQPQRREEDRDGIISYVDPSRYPLVWGKSHVLPHGGEVTCQGDIVSDLASPTKRARRHREERIGKNQVQERMYVKRFGIPGAYAFSGVQYEVKEAYLWSFNYQWLPTEVEFAESNGLVVRLKSYVNDLSPSHVSVDKALERLISLSIEPWNDCLVRGQSGWEDRFVKLPDGGWAPPGNARHQRGRVPCRIITYGVEWENELGDWTVPFDDGKRWRLKKYKEKLAEVEAIKTEQPPRSADKRTRIKYKLRLKEAQSKIPKNSDVEGIDYLPEPTPKDWAKAKEYLERPEPGSSDRVVLPEGWQQDVRQMISDKARSLVKEKLPEPGVAFSYHDWKSGTHGGRALVDMVTHKPIKANAERATTPHEAYSVCIQDEFRSRGLQVLIRVAGITLTPDNPEYAGSNWEMQGQLNEHIVATTMFAYDVHNVTDNYVAFRQETDVIPDIYHYGFEIYQTQGTYNWHKQPPSSRYKAGEKEAIIEMLGFNPRQMCRDECDFVVPMQTIGNVALPQGRLITFPNTIEYRRKPFRLQDPTKPGHHRWIEVMLVDPNYRICSTRNVPPQQADWKGRDGSGEVSQGSHFTEEEAERHKKEMADEHRMMMLARYSGMKLFFFC